MSVEIRPVTTIQETEALIGLQITAWQAELIDVIPPHLLITVAKNGGLVLVAYEAGRAVGFTLGWLGSTPAGLLKLVSHITGVHPDCQNRSVGYQLKLAQRDWALARNLDLVTWTYDPLESRNASLNLRRLGAICGRYERNVYGELADGINTGVESDRFHVEWWIDSDHVRRRLAGEPAPARSELDAPLLNPADFGSDRLPRPAAAPAAPAGERVLVEIPADIQALRAADLGLVRAWRLQTRAVLEAVFAAGYVATHLLFEPGAAPAPRSYYLLERKAIP